MVTDWLGNGVNRTVAIHEASEMLACRVPEHNKETRQSIKKKEKKKKIAKQTTGVLKSVLPQEHRKKG